MAFPHNDRRILLNTAAFSFISQRKGRLSMLPEARPLAAYNNHGFCKKEEFML